MVSQVQQKGMQEKQNICSFLIPLKIVTHDDGNKGVINCRHFPGGLSRPTDASS